MPSQPPLPPPAPEPVVPREPPARPAEPARDDSGRPLCVLFVHAHPDDEASKGSATMARYAAEGIRTVVVTATGGEAGDILNPAVDTAEVRADLPAVRRRELEESCRVLGVSALHLLGYHDSGMPDSEDNARPDNFWNADLDEAVGRLVGIVREERPQVLVTYGDDHSRYPHPDHIRTHEIGLAAYHAAGDPTRYRDRGEPWQPAKLYYCGFWSRDRILVLHEWFVGAGQESPYTRFLEHLDQADVTPFTTRVDCGPWLAHRRASLLAHATQIAPDSMWLRMPDEALARLFPWEEYVLAHSHVDPGVGPDEWEPDLFRGLRPPLPPVSTADPGRRSRPAPVAAGDR